MRSRTSADPRTVFALAHVPQLSPRGDTQSADEDLDARLGAAFRAAVARRRDEEAAARGLGRRRVGDPIPPPVVVFAVPREMAEHYELTRDDGVDRALAVLLTVPVPGWTWRVDESADAQMSLLAALRARGVDTTGVARWAGRERGRIETNDGTTYVAVRFKRR